MNTDHVQCYTCELSCNNCGLAPTFEPMPAATLSDVIRGFLLMHRRCEKPVEPSKQVEIFDRLAAKEPDTYALPDEPGFRDPEHDPEPEHDLPALTDEDDAFGRRYPMARDHLSLRMNLEVVLQGPAPSTEQLAVYPVGSPEFDTIAHWTRMQLAEMNKRSHPEFDVYLPNPPQPMPKVLKALMKPKRGVRPLSSPRKRRTTVEAP
jgi:hypothetical protein